MKNQQRTTVLHHAVRTVILLGLAVYIAFLVESDTLQLYIGIRIRPLVKLSSIVVYALAVIQGFIAYRAYRGSIIECDCCSGAKEKSWFQSGFLYSMLALPLLLGFLLPDTVLGGSFASKKGMILGASATPNLGAMYAQQQSANSGNAIANTSDDAVGNISNDAAGSAEGPTNHESSDASLSADIEENASGELIATDGTSGISADPVFIGADAFEQELAVLAERLYAQPVIEVKTDIYMEILTTIVTFQEQFAGKEIELTGFVYREKNLDKNQLVVGRIAVQCCTADATPYGVLTEFPEASGFADDTWVRLKGTLGQTQYNGNTIIKVDVTESEVIPAPDNPYIYPNFDFLDVSIP
ncbi:hypothetical protein J41TS12_44440 [Paenibacillus antibioticophila]|uniref:TIGR03943 family protein n=1 Tax=Paenibacillus antibioticophila TaxID=1274374 RepID=A0A920CJC3_9BACL|nr:TIGR03943 family protein [Paenibacillus antibioticophila]GIO39583.1 hypothetical protein J41TS12_44440 [Paenibacillus antibioticophila]